MWAEATRTSGLMRSMLGGAFAVLTLIGCGGSTAPDIDAATKRWQQRITKEIPVGTDLLTAKQWFETQGLQPYPRDVKRSKDLAVLLESMPAREWYCGKWLITVEVRSSPESKVAAYDFDAVGQCL